MGLGTSTEPFFIGVFPADMVGVVGMGLMVLPFDGAAAVTLGIYQEKEDIKKLDPKFLPAGAGGGGGALIVEATPDGELKWGENYYTLSTDKAEIMGALEKGQNVYIFALIPNQSGNGHYYGMYALSCVVNGTPYFSTFDQLGNIHIIAVENDFVEGFILTGLTMKR
jgi:hypothetical protein